MRKMYFQEDNWKSAYTDSQGAAEILGYTYDYFRHWISRRKDIQSKKVNGVRFFLIADLEEYKN